MNADDHSKAQILVVEDNDDLRAVLAERIRMEGYQALEAGAGLPALEVAELYRPNLIVLDQMLPDISGLEVARKLSEHDGTKSIPFIFLSARDEEIDRIVAFELGALDFVGKPFSMRELMLRIRAILGRMYRRNASSRQTLGPLTIDFEASQVWVDEREVRLTPREFNLLGVLVNRNGTVVSRSDAMDAVWDDEEEVLDRAVDTLVMRLRNRLGGAGALIVTVRGAGYRIDAGIGR